MSLDGLVDLVGFLSFACVCLKEIHVTRRGGGINIVNPLTAESIYMYAFGQIQVLAEFESSIFDEV